MSFRFQKKTSTEDLISQITELQRLQMTSLLVFLKQPNCIYTYVYLWLAMLAVVNAEKLEILQPEAGDIGSLNEESLGLHILRSRRIKKSPASRTLEMPALGRPLFPGVLYDARRDSFIPGVTLWDRKLLTEGLNTRPQIKTDVQLQISNTLNDRFSLLDVGDSLKASVLGGLVEVGGSAKYLSDSKSSVRQSRVTMYYSSTTRYEELSMSQLNTITYPQVFEQKSATHVVIAVLYGAQAVTVFDRLLSEEENFKETEAEVNLMFKKILQYQIQGNAASQMSDREKKFAEKISFTFHGDLHPGQSPTTYEEALNLYKNLPKELKENPQNAVPVKVWLYPLHLLNPKAARLEREIPADLVFSLEGIMEDLEGVERTYKELSENWLTDKFSDIRERLKSFHDSLRLYKSMFLKAVGRVLPAVRGGEKEDKSLRDILDVHTSSSFNGAKLKQWLKDAKEEISVLSSHVKFLDRFNIVEPQRVSTIPADRLFCLTFTTLKYEDPYLSALEEFVKVDRFNGPDGGESLVSVTPDQKWFHDPANINILSSNSNIFKRFCCRFASRVQSPCVISAISDPSNPGSSIYAYDRGQLIDKKGQASMQTVLDKFNFLDFLIHEIEECYRPAV